MTAKEEETLVASTGALAATNWNFNELDEVKKLADKAGSALEIVSLHHPMPGLPASIPVFVNREAGHVSSVLDQFEKYRTSPARKAGTAKVQTLESFIKLTTRHSTPHSVIFADTDWTKPSLTAVIDYHEDLKGGEADFGRHHIHYSFPLSEEWRAWTGINGKAMSQTDFAEFIENRIADLSAPDEEEKLDFQHKFSFRVAFPNELVTLSRGLQVNSETTVKTVVNLQSGEAQVAFEEEHRDAVGQKLNIPGMFILSVPPFFGGEAVRIPVRLRYRKAGDKLLWTCLLYRPDKYITDQVIADLTRAGSETNLPTFEGTPEMAGV